MLEDITGEEIKSQFKSNKNLRLITFAVIGLLVLVLGYFLYRQFIWGPKNEKSVESNYVGLNYAANDSTALAIDELSAHVKKYDGTLGGEQSQFVLARQFMNEGNFEQALKELEGVDLEDTYLSVMSVGLQGDCKSELKQYEDAYSLYMEAAEMQDNDFTTPTYLFKAGIVAEELNNWEKAAECYQTIKDDYTTFASSKQIDKYLARANANK